MVVSDLQDQVIDRRASAWHSLLQIACFGETQLPCSEDTQANLWRGPHGEGLRPPASTNLPQSKRVTMEGDPPPPAGPSGDCSQGAHLDYNPGNDLKVRTTW